MNPLLTQKCKPLEGGQPMGPSEIEAHLRQADGWSLTDGAIEKTYSFKNYHETMAFVNALAWIAHAEDHHPDLLVKYSTCQVRFNTHSVGGISINDFICAAKADALLG
jgi:4a-hydroxytetrahydrobiopterin dehydratase